MYRIQRSDNGKLDSKVERISIFSRSVVINRMMSSGMAAKKVKGFALLPVGCDDSPQESTIMQEGTMDCAVRKAYLESSENGSP